MKESKAINLCQRSKSVLLLVILIALTAIPILAQAPNEAEAMQRRLMRARALAAAHNLTAAAAELDNIRSTATDDSIKDVARIMLMDVYLEAADYAKALALLEETYKGVAGGSESSVRAYFTLAGQSVKGAREHIDRYRAFGINVANTELPQEALSDLDRLRTLLERVVEQAKQISGAGGKSTDAIALLEDASSVRMSLSRSREERQQWQGETTDARQKLAASETRIASLSPVAIRPQASSTPASSNSPALAGNNSASNPSQESSMQARNAPLTKKTVSIPEPRSPKPPKQEKSKQAESRPVQALVAPADGKPLDVGSLIDKASQKVAPSYPQTAKAARISGIVKVFVTIDENGTVTKIERSDGPAMLRGAAELAARQWKFHPIIIDGKPVRITGYISFNFTL